MQSFQPGLQNTLPLDQVLHNQSKCVVYGSGACEVYDQGPVPHSCCRLPVGRRVLLDTLFWHFIVLSKKCFHTIYFGPVFPFPHSSQISPPLHLLKFVTSVSPFTIK